MLRPIGTLVSTLPGRLAVALLLLAVAFPRGAWAEEEAAQTPAEAAEALYFALKRGGEEAFDAFVPTLEQARALNKAVLASLDETSRARAEKRQAERGGIEAFVTKMQAKAKERFKATRAKAVALEGWNESQFVGLDNSRARRSRQGPIQILEIRFLVRVGETLYSFGARDAFLLDGRWYFSEGISFGGPEGAENRNEIEFARMDIAQLKTELESVKADLRRAHEERERIRKHMNDQADQMDRHRAEESRRYAEEHKKLLDNMNKEREDLHRMIEKARSDLHTTKTELEASRAESEMHQARSGLELEHAKATLKASHERMAILERDDRWTRFLLESLAPVLLPALQHEDEMVRDSAEAAVERVSLRGATPHFRKVLADEAAKGYRRLRAARHLVRVGEAKAALPVLLTLHAKAKADGDDLARELKEVLDEAEHQVGK